MQRSLRLLQGCDKSKFQFEGQLLNLKEIEVERRVTGRKIRQLKMSAYVERRRGQMLIRRQLSHVEIILAGQMNVRIFIFVFVTLRFDELLYGVGVRSAAVQTPRNIVYVVNMGHLSDVRKRRFKGLQTGNVKLYLRRSCTIGS